MTEDKKTLTLNTGATTPAPITKKTRRKKTDTDDMLAIDPKEIPDGFTAEWKRYSIYGMVDTQHHMGLERDGWEYAQPKTFPSLVGKNYKGDMIFGGNTNDLVLMIRPKELTQEAVHEDKHNANKQVRTKLAELGLAKQGEAPRFDSAGRPLTKVNISYDRIPVGE